VKGKQSREKTKKSAAAKRPKVTPKIDPDRAEAAAEVLENVFLHEKHFDLESEIVRENGRPIATTNENDEVWITVRIHVPRLDVDTWLDGTHLDHPDNQPDDDDEEDA